MAAPLILRNLSGYIIEFLSCGKHIQVKSCLNYGTV